MPAADDEYGQFVAVAPIDSGWARAFNPGDPVPASTVKAHPEWVKEKLVAKADSKAADAASEPPA
jgi:hypothetical protein